MYNTHTREYTVKCCYEDSRQRYNYDNMDKQLNAFKQLEI